MSGASDMIGAGRANVAGVLKWVRECEMGQGVRNGAGSEEWDRKGECGRGDDWGRECEMGQGVRNGAGRANVAGVLKWGRE
eukprot:353698-Chlamydomonas_euryale.AAC.10